MLFNTLADKISPFLLDEKYHPYEIPTLNTKEWGGNNVMKTADTNKYLMYDFYVLSYLDFLIDSVPSKSFRDLNPEMTDSVKDAVKNLFPYLREELLSAVFYAICAEMRNTTINMSGGLELFPKGSKERKMYYTWLKYMRTHRSNGNYSPEDLEILGVRKPHSDTRTPELEKDNSSDRNLSFKAANYAIKQTGGTNQDFVEMATKMFFDGAWSSSYGGKPWGRIGKGWQILNASDKLTPHGKQSIDGIVKPMSVAIDHVYDLQHNTDTVFNKLKSYYSPNKGYSWIATALDHKANVKSYHDLLAHTSGAVKSMALPVLYNRLGTTWENRIEKDSPATTTSTSSSSHSDKNAGNNSRAIFKVGQYVEYIGPRMKGITKDKTYQVLSVDGNKIIGVLNDDGKQEKYFEYEFKPHKHIPVASSMEDQIQANIKLSQQQFGSFSSGPPPEAWKKGDTVECIDPGGYGGLTLGGQYQLLQNADKVNADGPVYIELDTKDNGSSGMFHSKRFKFIKSLKDLPNSQIPYASDNLTDVKIGDMVICVDVSETDDLLTIGKVYEVIYANTITLTIKNDDGYESQYYRYRFEKYEKVKPSNELDTSSTNSKVYKNQEMNGFEEATKENTRIGDDVVCINADGVSISLTVGKVYNILYIGDNWVELKNNMGIGGMFMMYRFKKLPPKSTDHSTWKHGDLLKCINNKGGARKELTLGQVYEADSYPIPTKSEGYYIEIRTIEGHRVGTFKTERFENVEKDQNGPEKTKTKVPATKVSTKKDAQKDGYFKSEGEDIGDKYDFKVGDIVKHKITKLKGEILKFFNQNGTDGATVKWDDNGEEAPGNWHIRNLIKLEEESSEYKKGDKLIYHPLGGASKMKVIVIMDADPNSSNVHVERAGGVKFWADKKYLKKAPLSLADVFNGGPDKRKPQVGDKVICVDPGKFPLTKGSKYEIESVSDSFDEDGIIYITDNNGHYTEYLYTRFKPAPKQKPRTFTSNIELENLYDYKVGDTVIHKYTGYKAKVLKFFQKNDEDGIEVEFKDGSTGMWKAVNAKFTPKLKEKTEEFNTGDKVNSDNGSHVGTVIAVGAASLQVKMDSPLAPSLWLPMTMMHKMSELEQNAKFKKDDKVSYTNLTHGNVYDGVVSSIKEVDGELIYGIYFKDFDDESDVKENDPNLQKALRPFKQKFQSEYSSLKDIPDTTQEFKIGDTVSIKSKITDKVWYGTIDSIDHIDKEACVKIPYPHGSGSHSEWFQLDQLTHDIKI